MTQNEKVFWAKNHSNYPFGCYLEFSILYKPFWQICFKFLVTNITSGFLWLLVYFSDMTDQFLSVFINFLTLKQSKGGCQPNNFSSETSLLPSHHWQTVLRSQSQHLLLMANAQILLLLYFVHIFNMIQPGNFYFLFLYDINRRFGENNLFSLHHPFK